MNEISKPILPGEINKHMQMSFLAEPSDVNFGGQVHGGQVMKWMDQIGYALSVKYSGGYAVTKFIDNIDFINPIQIGDLVKLEAKIITCGKTSMTLEIRVCSENLTKRKELVNCTCSMVFVAVDSDGKKRLIISTT